MRQKCRRIMGLPRRYRFLPLVAACLAASGCGGGDELQTIVVHGTVTHEGQIVELGTLRFVPIGGTKGPASHARITDGKYRIDARGGVPVGRHRVEIEALRKTGRKVPGPVGFEDTMVDETERLGPPEYTGASSPLSVEVTAGSDGKIDIEIPAKAS